MSNANLLELFDITVGLEVHVELLTRSKMFSSSPNSYGARPNSQINEIDVGYPGTMPSVNGAAVQLSIVLAHALGMKIEHKEIRFDRKHYFYPDLPKGYQITQFYNPIGRDGKLDIEVEGQKVSVLLERAHIEEDSAKTVGAPGVMQIDYNRAGVPLVEIVTRPCLKSAAQAMAYLTELKKILQFKRISAARMEEGSMRCDVNISVAPKGAPKLGTRVEVKNINSISNVGKAIMYEARRHISEALANRAMIQETRHWDDAAEVTMPLRAKDDAIDYKYIAEPNIPPISVTEEEVKQIVAMAAPGPAEVRQQLIDGGLNPGEVETLLGDYDLYDKVRDVASAGVTWKSAFLWVAIEGVGITSKLKLPQAALTKPVLNELGLMAKAIAEERISARQGKEIAVLLIRDRASLKQALENPMFTLISDPAALKLLVEEEMKAAEQFVAMNLAQPARVANVIIGAVMRRTNGRANPTVLAALAHEAANARSAQGK